MKVQKSPKNPKIRDMGNLEDDPHVSMLKSKEGPQSICKHNIVSFGGLPGFEILWFWTKEIRCLFRSSTVVQT